MNGTLSLARAAQRRWSRVALYASLVVCAVAVVPLARAILVHVAPGSAAAWGDVDWAAKPEVELLRQYLQFNTTSDQGNELEAARWFADQLAAIGVNAEIEQLDERHANLYAVIEGDDPSALILHHHIDTDPVNSDEAWNAGPFAGTIRGPWLYGRGAYDMKSVAIAQLVAVTKLLEQRPRPARTIVIIASSSEEAGSDLGMERITWLRPELFEGAFAFLTEGGFVEPTSLEEVKYWATEVGQKGYVWVEVCHGSRQLLEQVAEDLQALAHPIDRLRLEPIVAEYLSGYAATRTWKGLADQLSDPAALIADLASFQQLPPVFQALFRSQAALWGVEEDPEGGFRLPIALHLLPGDDPHEAIERFVPTALLGGGMRTAVIDPPSLISPRDHVAYIEMQRVLEKRYPGVPRGMAYLPQTATDSRFVRRLGVPAYGFSPFLVFAADTFTMSGPNERIGLPGYVDGVAIYAELVRRLAG